MIGLVSFAEVGAIGLASFTELGDGVSPARNGLSPACDEPSPGCDAGSPLFHVVKEGTRPKPALAGWVFSFE
jgi:hypothetical protein